MNACPEIFITKFYWHNISNDSWNRKRILLMGVGEDIRAIFHCTVLTCHNIIMDAIGLTSVENFNHKLFCSCRRMNCLQRREYVLNKKNKLSGLNRISLIFCSYSSKVSFGPSKEIFFFSSWLKIWWKNVIEETIFLPTLYNQPISDWPISILIR